MVVALLGGAVALSAAAGCAKPCDPIPEPPAAKKLGFVLDGGLVCKDSGNVSTVDYPKADADKLTDEHKSKLEKDGWKVEIPSDLTLLATKGEADTLFIVLGKKSKERGVPFAVVRYCEDKVCRKDLSELAAAMKK